MQNFIVKNKKQLRDYWDHALSKLPDAWFYKQGDHSNIAIWASRRGGSSIFSELIATSGGIREIDQPFDSFREDRLSFRCRKQLLLDKALCQYYDLNAEEWSVVQQYLQRLSSGGHRAAYPMAFSKARKDRTVFKILNAPFLADEITHALQFKSIHLTRHPIPQALSVIRSQWGLTYEPYISSAWIKQGYFTALQIAKIEELDRDGSALEKYVLNWVFENLFLLKSSKVICLRVAYEDLVVQPELVAEKLESELGLSVDVAVLSRPSRSQKWSTVAKNASIANADRSALISSWLSSVTDEDIARVQSILDVFEIDSYRADEVLPKREP